MIVNNKQIVRITNKTEKEQYQHSLQYLDVLKTLFKLSLCFPVLDGIPCLVNLLKNDDPEVRQFASLALANLTTANPNAR